MRRPTIAPRLAVFAGLSLALFPIASAAQRTEGRNLSIAYESGGPTRNGYMDAQVEITYYFGRCADRVAFLARYNPTPQMLVGNHRYWVDGRQVEVPPHIAPPRLESPVIRGTVRGNGITREINYLYATPAATPGCLTNDVSLGMATEFWPVGTDEGRRLAILNGFGLDQRGTLPPLRNSAVEGHFRQIFAAERADSLAKARSAEQARLQARRDSITRAQAAQAQRDSATRAAQQRQAASTAGSSGATAATAGAASATSGSANQREQTEAERAAAERAEADARVAAVQEQIRQQQAAEELRQQQAEQMAEATAQVAVAAFGLVESIIESRRSAKAERERVERLRQAAASAAYAQYVSVAKARFDAAPARPLCTVADARDTLRLSLRSVSRSVQLTGNECRLQGGQSAVMLSVVLENEAPVVIKTSSSAYESIHLLNASTNRWVFTGREQYVALNLDAGQYVLFVSSRHPGEVGDVTIDTRTGWISDAQGSIGGAMGPAQTINGFVGTNTTSSSWMDLTLGFQSRLKLPYLYFSLLVPTDTDAQEAHFDIGLRQYLGPRDANVKPWIEAGFGYREIFVLQEPFRTFSPAIGAGINWRLNEGNGLALSATYITGEAKNGEDIWTSPPPPIKLSRTIVRLGWMLY